MSISLFFSGGRVAQLFTTASSYVGSAARIVGQTDSKHIQIPSHIFYPSKLIIGDQEVTEPPPELVGEHFYINSSGLANEAKCVHDCIAKGLTECPNIPLDESILITEIMDECRRQVGVNFPADQ